MMSKNDLKGVMLAAIAGVVAMIIYDKIKGGVRLAPRPSQNIPRTNYSKETDGPMTWEL
jgi:hypothetical protein